jgi:flavin reductase (DIM6/NTAB) family NADH-FMN oxidoreductase RutF
MSETPDTLEHEMHQADAMEAVHAVVEPAILYLGTPVVLISTRNEDGSPNLAPMSSAWWLGWGCMLGLNASSKTTENLLRTRECVLNLPAASLVGAVDRIALTTGSNPVPANKIAMGFKYVPDKFGAAGLTPQPADLVAPPRVRECAVQLEAVVEQVHPFGATNPRVRTKMNAIEVRILRVHVDPRVLVDGEPNRIDPEKWRPLIMSFRQFYTLGGMLQPSRLAQFPEDKFRPATEQSASREPGASPRV